MKFDVGILASQPLPVLVRQVQLAESLGFDTAWIADTHLVCRELWVTLAACAAGTSRIRLGPGIAVPHTRHISVTASAIATLHEMAEGRVVIGVGTGGSAAETMGLSVGKVARIATLESMAVSLRRLLGRESIRLENGADARLAWLERSPAIPLYLAGSGPRMLDAAGRLGDGAIMYSGVAPWLVEAALGCVKAGARTAGRDPDDLDVAIWAPTSIAPDRALARDHVRGRVASALRHAFPLAWSPEDQAVIDQVRAAYDSYQHASAASKHRLLVTDRFVDLMALAGRPEEVREQVQGIIGVGGVGRIILLPQVPGQDFVEREEVLRLFAEQVMARL
ncbi:MAG TPA: LLM class flavin-dependent oxidoreductase [Methylomirabilota bacterium]|nr:LLM class flavin-dependent oxidoreductase [Methylomirabilota bacterium]